MHFPAKKNYLVIRSGDATFGGGYWAAVDCGGGGCWVVVDSGEGGY